MNAQEQIVNKRDWIPTLIKQAIPESSNDFYSNQHKIAIDLGCRNPIDVFTLYHSIGGFERLHAIDDDSDKFPNGKSKIVETATTYKHYQSYNFKNSVNEESFDTLFKINLSIKGEEYLDVIDDEFDLVIVSNFLHMYNEFSKAKHILNRLIQRLKKNGLLYFSVANEHHENIGPNDRLAFHESKILEFLKPLEEKIFVRKKIHYQGIFQKKS